MRGYLLLALMGLLVWPAAAEVTFKPLGSLSTPGGVLSVWRIQGGQPDPAAAVKVQSTGKEGEANVVVTSAQLVQLLEFCQKALSSTSQPKAGEIKVFGTISSASNKIDVALCKYQGKSVCYIGAHEGTTERGIWLEKKHLGALSKLLNQAAQSLSQPTR